MYKYKKLLSIKIKAPILASYSITTARVYFASKTPNKPI